MAARGLLLLTAWLTAAGVAFGATGEARRHVAEGVQHFQAGDFQAAAKSFADADVALPDNPRVAFDRGCALAKLGEADKALELFQAAALDRDQTLVASSHYNMGCLVAQQARAIFGESPQDAPPDVREKGLTLLAKAVEHYRDCLQADSQHTAARRNLETLRLWIKHMQELWAQRDRQKQRDEATLLQFVEMLLSEQEALHGQTRSLIDVPDSPRQRQTVSEAESTQKSLADEIEPLKTKIDQFFEQARSASQSAGGQTSSSNPPAPEADQARRVLSGLADDAGKSMTGATDQLAQCAVREAANLQSKAIQSLLDIYSAVAPFSDVLNKATTRQEALTDRSQSLVNPSGSNNAAEAPPEQEDSNANAAVDNPSAKVPSAHTEEPKEDFEDLARQESTVERLSQMLPLKAEQELKQLDSAQAEAAQNKPPSASAPAGGGKPAADPKQLEQYQTALKKAIDVGPEVEGLAREAASRLTERDAPGALPKQQRALALLKEIEDSLPKEQKPPQEQQQNADKQSGNQQEQKDRDRNQQEQKQNRKQAAKEQSRQEAEAILRKVRERERQHKELQMQMNRYVNSPVKVDKDW